MLERGQSGERVYRGIPVSAGVSHGKTLVISKSKEEIPMRVLAGDEIAAEVERLQRGLMQTRQDILEVQRKVSEGLGAEDASIFDAHLLVLEDRTLLDEVTRLIREEKVNVEHAFSQVAQKYIATLDAIEDEYLRERAADMRDVASRVLNNLMGRKDENALRRLKDPGILISHDITPSTTAQLDKNLVLGFATDVGSKTSHSAIMARSLQIPAVAGLRDASQQIRSGEYALLDGYNGLIIVNPTDQTLFEYGQIIRKTITIEEKLRDLRDKPAVTLDGKRIILSANLEQPEAVGLVTQNGAEGVGLFRTEYLFINRECLPTEQEQYQAYHKVASSLKDQPVVIRTLDLGGDKFLSHLQVPQEMNPFLGWRAIRYCLQERAIFREQLRAILRASAVGNVKLMYPMISCLEELIQANQLVEDCKAELRAENVPFDENIEIGAMIEVPSAALSAIALGKRVKFFSIGTNDLIQYTLAVDRMNERIAHLYEPTHPSIMRLIKMTVEAGEKNGIWVGVCGEMAGDPALIPLLLGLGVTELSVAVPYVPQIKFLIRRMKMTEAQELADFALACECPKEILKRSEEMGRRIAPSLFESRAPKHSK